MRHLEGIIYINQLSIEANIAHRKVPIKYCQELNRATTQADHSLTESTVLSWNWKQSGDYDSSGARTHKPNAMRTRKVDFLETYTIRYMTPVSGTAQHKA